MMRSFKVFICLLVLLCLLTGCNDPVGVSIVCDDILLTLPADFIDLSGDSYGKDADFLYGRKTLVFMGLAEKKTSLQEMTLDEYTGYVISGNGIKATPHPFGDGYLFSYEADIEHTAYTYTVATYEAEENFWIFQFYCPSTDLENSKPEIDIILQSIQPKKTA